MAVPAAVGPSTSTSSAVTRWWNGQMQSAAAAAISSSGAVGDSATVRWGTTSSNAPPYGG